ncbi:MAG: hypothetical protein ABL999_15490 [Pyrinomonadaceae bacterium]
MRLQDEGILISIDGLLTAEQLLSGSPAETHAAFKLIQEEVDLGPDALVFAFGDKVDKIYLHLSGHLVQISDLSEFLSIDTANADKTRIYGLIEALSNKPHKTGMKTVTKCTFFVIRRSDFFKFLRENPGVSYRLAERLSRSYRRAIEKLRSH